MIDHAVLIAAAEALPAMRARLASEVRDLVAFSDTEALRALEAITTRRPAAVMLERRFASTPRGTALVNRIKADPTLSETQIRIVAPDASVTTEAPAAPPPGAAAGTGAAASKGTAAGTKHVAPAPAPELDYRGTRRAPRYQLASSREVMVDGNKGTLVDLSILGAQMVTPSVLKPNQRVRVAFLDDEGTIRCVATVVWALFEMPRGGSPHYRAGLDFVEPDAGALDAFIRRHKTA